MPVCPLSPGLDAHTAASCAAHRSALNDLRLPRAAHPRAARRLSTVRDADSIAVVFKGKIIEQGSHDEVRLAQGRAAELCGGHACLPGVRWCPPASPYAITPSLPPLPSHPQLMAHAHGSYARLVRHQLTRTVTGSTFRSTTSRALPAAAHSRVGGGGAAPQ